MYCGACMGTGHKRNRIGFRLPGEDSDDEGDND
jgi:hypothetical protein